MMSTVAGVCGERFHFRDGQLIPKMESSHLHIKVKGLVVRMPETQHNRLSRQRSFFQGELEMAVPFGSCSDCLRAIGCSDYGVGYGTFFPRVRIAFDHRALDGDQREQPAGAQQENHDDDGWDGDEYPDNGLSHICDTAMCLGELLRQVLPAGRR